MNDSSKPLIKNNKIALVRGERLLSLRGFARLSREKLETLAHEHGYTIKVRTIRSYEDGIQLLDEKNVEPLLETFKKYGIVCSQGWLLHGIGAPPLPTTKFSQPDSSATAINKDAVFLPYLGITHNPQHKNENSALQELETFYSLNPAPIHFIVEDDAMEPQFSEQDIVAGNIKLLDEIPNLINSPCIVQTTEGEKHFRLLLNSDQKSKYDLRCLNINTRAKNAMLANQTLIYAAQVIWHRKILN
jgi:hypothetical protein